jgi:hypothetical protein
MNTAQTIQGSHFIQPAALCGGGRLGFILNMLCLLVLAAPGSLRAQKPRFVNAQFQSRPVDGGLARTFRSLVARQNETAWIAYAVPVVDGNYHVGGSSPEDLHLPLSLRRSHCELEGGDDGMNFQTDSAADGLEKSEYLLVLYRVVGKSVRKIRVFTDDCELDAGGRTVYWLTGVSAAESAAWLTTFVDGSSESTQTGPRREDAAITAMALHAGAEADRALQRFVDPMRPEEMRKTTVFWLGSARGQKGYEVLRLLVRQDPSDKIREQCIFALHVSNVPEAISTIIDIGRHDPSPHLRGQALFWLSQKATEKAARAVTDAIENDPETEVKKKAVFALSQLPKDQGVPKLIQVARTNRNHDVRKDAMFWLGQSNDQRALAFFEEVLTH